MSELTPEERRAVKAAKAWNRSDQRTTEQETSIRSAVSTGHFIDDAAEWGFACGHLSGFRAAVAAATALLSADAALAAKDAEIGRLREALTLAREDVRHYGVRAITQAVTASGCEEARDRVNATLTIIDAALLAQEGTK